MRRSGVRLSSPAPNSRRPPSRWPFAFVALRLPCQAPYYQAPYCQSRKRAPPRMSGKGCDLPFPFHTEAEHGTTLSKTCRSSTTPAHPSSSAVALTRFQTVRHPLCPCIARQTLPAGECRNLARHTSSHPPPNYQINHNLIFQSTTTQYTDQSHLNIQTHPTRTTRSITT